MILAYDSVLVKLRSADDQTRVWTISFIEYPFFYCAMFSIDARDEASSSYYNYKTRFYNPSGSPLFLISKTFLYALM